jgi:hypothetical protein
MLANGSYLFSVADKKVVVAIVSTGYNLYSLKITIDYWF